MGQKERLKGTKTEQNLMSAFKGESEARNKYTYFSGKAEKEGYIQISKIFEETANNEKEHGKLWYKYLTTIGTTAENLKTALEAEKYEAEVMYPQFSKEAREEGFEDIADTFREVAEIENEHYKRYKKLLENIEKEKVFTSAKEVEWHCLNCGYIHKSKTAPKTCPACKHGQEYFERHGANY